MNIPLNTEEPTRIKKFREDLDGFHWTENQRLENLNQIFNALHKVALNDLEYYNQHRKKSKKIFKITMSVSSILAVFGTLIIILQGVSYFGSNSTDMAIIGSALFSVAAAVLAWNKLFCIGGNHIRYVIAQFELGKEITQFELAWQDWQNKNADAHPDKVTSNAAFSLFKDFSKKIYEIIRNDTQKWEKDLIATINEQQNNLNGK